MDSPAGMWPEALFGSMEQKIKFQGRKKGFSTIVGENGAGKSNILNAINWCF